MTVLPRVGAKIRVTGTHTTGTTSTREGVVTEVDTHELHPYVHLAGGVSARLAGDSVSTVEWVELAPPLVPAPDLAERDAEIERLRAAPGEPVAPTITDGPLFTLLKTVRDLDSLDITDDDIREGHHRIEGYAWLAEQAYRLGQESRAAATPPAEATRP